MSSWECGVDCPSEPPLLPRRPITSCHAVHLRLPGMNVCPTTAHLSCAAEQPLHDGHPVAQRRAPAPAGAGGRHQQRAHPHLPLKRRLGSYLPGGGRISSGRQSHTSDRDTSAAATFCTDYI